MVAALVHGKRRTIESLNDLAEVVQSSLSAHESLIILGDRDERYEFRPDDAMTDEERRAAVIASFGVWKDLVDGEQLKRDIYASRGQRDRDWMIAETSEDEG
jgi:hypothetical protein